MITIIELPGSMIAHVYQVGENGAYPPTKSGSIHPLLS